MRCRSAILLLRRQKILGTMVDALVVCDFVIAGKIQNVMPNTVIRDKKTESTNKWRERQA
jgi:hypothetical protein